jgi:plastocyanin
LDPQKKKPTPLLLSLTVLSIFLLLTGCASNGGQQGGDGASKKEEKMEHAHGKMQKLDDFYFEPKTVTIKRGEKVTLTLHNEGQVEHTFTIKGLGIDEEVEPGKSKTVTIEGKQPGTYDLICKYHEQMRGKVIVEK